MLAHRVRISQQPLPGSSTRCGLQGETRVAPQGLLAPLSPLPHPQVCCSYVPLAQPSQPTPLQLWATPAGASCSPFTHMSCRSPAGAFQNLPQAPSRRQIDPPGMCTLSWPPPYPQECQPRSPGTPVHFTCGHRRILGDTRGPSASHTSHRNGVLEGTGPPGNTLSEGTHTPGC